MSYHYDCILYANEMNKLPGLAKQMQYDYHLNAVRAYKRPFRKWEKPEKSEDLEAVKLYHKYSNEKTREALGILTESQIADIKQRLQKGGASKKMSQKNDRE